MSIPTKEVLRKEILHQLRQQNHTQRARKSRKVMRILTNLAEFQRAGCILFYLAKREEVQTASAIRQAQKLSKKIAVPVVLEREKRMIASFVENIALEVAPGPYGILQPKARFLRQVPLRSIDLVIVPAVAFDRRGHRLGRGLGYYDRFLATLPESTPCVGLAFDFQVVERLPVLSHDIAVNTVISA